MSFFEDASLVLIPSAQKTSKVYSVKPTDGTGDLTFTRSNDTATRVGPDGLIEKVRTNRFTYSQDLSNAAWKTATDGGSITKTANAGTAPDGTNTATRVQVAGGGTYSLVYQDSVNPLGSVVVSGYFKRYGGTNQTFRLFGDNGSALSGTLTATDTWQRFSFVMNASSAGADGLAADASNNAYDILVWGMQLETGDIATDYIATTSAAVSVGPVANVPRLDYLNSSCPRLLLEPQRTNFHQFSEQLQNFWTYVDSTLTANTTISPDGYQNADTITKSSSNTHVYYNLGAGASGTTYTFSAYYKGTAGQTIYMRFLQGGGGTDAEKLITFTGEWQRESITFTGGSSYNIYYLADYRLGGSATSFQAWGCQLEVGSYPSSYIGPTLGAAVTRGVDAASKTGISSLLGATEGVVFLEVGDIKNNNSTGAEVWYFEMRKDQDNSFGLASGGGTPQPIRFVTKIAGTAVTETEPAPFANSKIAIKYTSTQFKLFRNGTLLYTTNKSIGDYADIQFMEAAGVNLLMVFKQFLVFPTALSDADCISLTA